MKSVRLWGTRGSLPVALTAADVRAKMEAVLRGARGRVLDTDADIAAYLDGLDFHLRGSFGGHSSCVEIATDGPEHVICDLGTGVRPYGQAMMRRFGANQPQTYHVFMSHLHWDHIMGLPFFAPAYTPGNRIFIYGCHAELEAALVRQQAQPSFPVDFSAIGRQVSFVTLEPGQTREIAGLSVTPKKQLHGGDSYGYRFEAGGRTVVYSTDSEHRLGDSAQLRGFIEFFRGADLVVFDAMYSLAEAITIKADWGHSSNLMGVELCRQAGVKHLCLFHHEPVHGDADIARVLAETLQYDEALARSGPPMQISAAYDGQLIEL